MFPEGTWEHFFTGERVEGSKMLDISKTIDCPIGTPAAYKKV
jgi:alpha-glucosidase (family GH31 glycosyl hydrolase)